MRFPGDYFFVSFQKFRFTDKGVDIACSQLSHYFAQFARDKIEIVGEIFRFPRETFLQNIVLGGNTESAVIQMAMAQHHAAHRNQRGSSEAIFLGAQYCRDGDVSSRAHLAVGLQTHART